MEELRVRTRRRLIGAAVLVIVAVVALPLVFEGPPRAVSPRVAIELPPRAGGAASATIEMAPGRHGSVASGAGPATVVIPPVPRAPEGAEAARAAAAVAAEAASTAGKAAPVLPALRPPVAPQPPQPAPGVVRKPPAAQRPVPAGVADPVDRPAVRKPAAEESRPRPAAVTKDVARAPGPEKAEKSDRTEKADRADKKDKAAKPPVKPAAAESRVWVQVGAFAEPSTARAVRQKVDKLGLRAQEQTVETAAGQRTRVRLGPYTSREDAEKAIARLRGGGLSATVVAP